jgi:hypothetical protein
MKSKATDTPTGTSESVLHARLQLLFSAALRTSADALDGFSGRLCDALGEAARSAPDPAAATALGQATDNLSRDALSFQRLYSDCLQQAFQLEAQGLLGRSRKRLGREALDLSLTSFDAMQRKVVIDNHAQAFDRMNAERLAILQARIAHWLRRDVAGMRNPFRAEVFLQAVVDAWHRFEAHEAARAVLLQHLGPQAFLSLELVLMAVDQELVARDVLPLAEQDYRRNRERGAFATPLLQAERRALRRPGTVYDRAIEILTRSGTLPAHACAHLNTLSPALRQLARDEPHFLRNAHHPGRRLLQAVVHASLASDPASPSGAALLALIKRVAARLKSDMSAKTLEPVCGEVEALLANLLKSMEARRDQHAADAAREEAEQRAEALALGDVMPRLEAGAVAGFIDHFLLTQWSGVLRFARHLHADKPELIANLVQAMDDLIWSTQLKESEEERENVRERLPGLLVLLNAWLKLMKWEGAESDSFFAELAARHAVVVGHLPEATSRALLEQRMDDAQRATEHALTRQAAEQADDALSAYMRQIEHHVPGDWAEFVRNDGSTVNCRLAWISPARTRFVFIAPQAQLSFAISDLSLAQGMRAGRTRYIAAGEVFGVALASALRELSAESAMDG